MHPSLNQCRFLFPRFLAEKKTHTVHGPWSWPMNFRNFLASAVERWSLEPRKFCNAKHWPSQMAWWGWLQVVRMQMMQLARVATFVDLYFLFFLGGCWNHWLQLISWPLPSSDVLTLMWGEDRWENWMSKRCLKIWQRDFLWYAIPPHCGNRTGGLKGATCGLWRWTELELWCQKDWFVHHQSSKTSRYHIQSHACGW